MPGSPIVDAKITMPPPNRWVPPRPQAWAKLDRGEDLGTSVVAAGPGYLKRQVVESWIRSDPRRRVAWVSLDDADDPIRLFAHAVTAVRSAAPRFAPDVDAAELPAPGNWEARAADSFVEALGELAEPLVLVFDGVHRLVDSSARRGIEMLLRYRPEQVHLIVLTRDDAAIDLASATVSGSLAELREPDLGLDPAQTAHVLAAAGVEATADEVARLHAATGGWPAGVVLAANRAIDDGVLAPFAPELEPVQSYLQNRVLDAMDDDLGAFFLQVAPLRLVNPELAAHATGRNDAGRLLDRLADLHLTFDSRRRPGWRKVPEYLQRFALHELRARDDAAARSLCRRAARWCWERELLDESMTIAACGEDSGLMAEILLEHHLAWTAAGQADRVRAWCSLLLQAEPNLVEAQLAGAWASWFLGDDAAASSAVALLAARDLPGDRGTLVAGELAVLRSHLARRRGDMGAALAAARDGARAADDLSEGFSTPYRGALPSSTALHIGIAAFWADEPREAVVQMEQAREEEIWAAQSLPVIHGYLSMAHWLLDEGAALAHADTALMYVREGSVGAGDFAALCMGTILGVEGMSDETVRQVKAMAATVDEPVTHVLAAAAEAVYAAQTDPARAREAMRRGRSVADACPDPRALRTVMAKVAQEIGVDTDPVFGQPLTAGEERVLRMLSGPSTEREIAEALHLSHNTVRTYRRRLYRKLGYTSRDDVVSPASGSRGRGRES